MSYETIVVLVAIGLVFLAFAAGLTYADLRTREFRD
jgi:hypothetical protein